MLPIVIIILGIAIRRGNPAATYTRHINQGNRYYEQQDYISAMREYSAALKLVPNDRDALLLRGMANYRVGRYQKAIDDDTKALTTTQIGDVLAALHYNRGMDYEALNKLPLAIEDYSASLSIQPRNWDAMINRADCYRRTNQLDAAIRDVNTYLAGHAKSYFAFTVRGFAELGKKQWSRSEADFEAAVAIKRDEFQGWGALAWAQYMCDDTKDAIASNLTAIRLNPRAAMLYLNQGLCYAQQDNWAEAKREYETGIKKCNKFDLNSARGDIQDALKRHPDSAGLKQARQLLADAKPGIPG